MLPVLWRLALVASFLLFILASPPVVALLASPAEQQELEQRQRSLLKDAARQRDEVSRSVFLPLPTVPSGAEPAGPCFTVTHIRIDGAGVLDAKTQAALTAKYLGTCMGLSHINTLIRDISQWYLSAGYVTSRAFLPEQNLAGGSLVIDVLEGRVEAILVNGHALAQGHQQTHTDRSIGFTNISREETDDELIHTMEKRHEDDDHCRTGPFDHPELAQLGCLYRARAQCVRQPG